MRPVIVIPDEDQPARSSRHDWLQRADALLCAIEEHNLVRGPRLPVPTCMIRDAVALGVSRHAGHSGASMHEALLHAYTPWLLRVREIRRPARRPELRAALRRAG